MLVELSVRDLGVIEELSLVLGEGMTALTGETGAGKTLVVQAIQLLTGGRTDPSLVRPGAREAVVEGRFVAGDDEVVMTRVIPADGRSRAYVNGRMASAADLGSTGERLVDLHGQHSHQSLLSPAVQRRSLDAHGQIDLTALTAARAHLSEVRSKLLELGGDARSRAHEIDLLRYQLDELGEAALSDDDEDQRLEREADVLGDAAGHIEAAGAARTVLSEERGALDRIGEALAAMTARGPFKAVAEQLRGVQAELEDVASQVRDIGEAIEDNPARASEIRARRQLILDLTRKYGDTVAEVREFEADASSRLDRLVRHEELAGEYEEALDEAGRLVAHEAKRVADARRIAAAPLAKAVTAGFEDLALARATLDVAVRGDEPCDDVEFLFAANSGSSALPLSKVASGGELARVMLSLRLVLSAGPETLVFDEVDAGIGGEAAIAVGSSLGRIGGNHQVLVVTHLPQVAAFADQHVVITKTDDGVGVQSSASHIDGEARVVELARMLAGRPDSAAGREHASELLSMGDEVRSGRGA